MSAASSAAYRTNSPAIPHPIRGFRDPGPSALASRGVTPSQWAARKALAASKSRALH